ncbi:hypothetical protein D3C78_1862900 [compost metagenome]
MNSEMQDDLILSHRMYGEEAPLENLAEQSADLTQGLYMAMESLMHTYEYACRIMRKRKR